MAKIPAEFSVKGRRRFSSKKYLHAGGLMLLIASAVGGDRRHLYSSVESRPGEPMSWLKLLFVWWRGATLGTLFSTWWTGRSVGEDVFGNRYFQNSVGTRRWVIYNGTVEASRVPAEWHGWLHHTFRNPPTVAVPRIKAWEKEHLPNMSGTDAAYHPPGSLAAAGKHAPATGDYQAWVPD